MKTSSLLLAATLFCSAASASAQSFTSSNQLRGTTPIAVANRPYTQRVAGGGSITYFSTEHTCEPAHEQFARLRQVFETSKPTVVFYEHPDMGIDSTETATISRLGESGYVRFLAQQRQVATERLDDPQAEYEHLLATADPAQVKLYYLVRQAQLFRARTGAAKGLTVRYMRDLLLKSPQVWPGTAQVIRNLAELEVAYHQYCATGGEWWKAPATPTGAVAAIDRQVRAYRQEYMARKLAEKAQAGQRVLVVAGPTTMPVPAPAIALAH